MANKILCGGFKIDGTSLVEENGILRATAIGLPDASEATNGQGLIVDDGEFVIGDLPQGGGSSGPIVANMVAGQEPGTAVLDKTWQEIHDAGAGSIVFDTGNGIKPGLITTIYADESVPEYGIEAAIFDSSKVEWKDMYFVAATTTDNPVLQISEQES